MTNPDSAIVCSKTPGGAADTTPPPGLDVSKLDDFQRKVFFRIANAEASVCGQAQSLIASAKAATGGCRKSYNALKYVAKLVVAGFTDSEVGEALAKRYRNNDPKTIDVAEAPMIERAAGIVQVFAGTMEDAMSPAPYYSPLVGVDLRVHPRQTLAIPLEPAFEHAVLVMSGDCAFDGENLAYQGRPPGSAGEAAGV